MTESKRLGAVIAVGNQKGGVGKSTNTTHIAAALGQRGMQCLIIDLDPGAGSTKLLGVPVDSFSGSLELLTTDEGIDSLAITAKMPQGVHLIPSRVQLNEIDTQLSKFVDRTRILDRPLAEARECYDFIFLDTGHTPVRTNACEMGWETRPSTRGAGGIGRERTFGTYDRAAWRGRTDAMPHGHTLYPSRVE